MGSCRLAVKSGQLIGRNGLTTRSLPYSRWQMSVFVVLDSSHHPRLPAVRALTLLVRNFTAALAASDENRYPALESVFSRGAVTTSPHNSITGWACATHGIERQGDWPAGAMLAHAFDEPAAGPCSDGDGPPFWICAQPVHLSVDRDSLILQPPAQLLLTDRESRELFHALSKHLGDEQLETRYATSAIWCIGSHRNYHLSTTDIATAQGRSIDGRLPAGPDGRTWQRLVTEAQMLLHEHPVNAAREARGELPVNSIWIWGSGTLPAIGPHFHVVSAVDPLLRATGILSGARMIDTPVNLAGVPEDGRALVELILADGDDDGSLPTLEKNWLVPAWEALSRRLIDELTLILPLSGAIAICRCGHRERRRFWRRRHTMPEFLARFAEATLQQRQACQ